MHMHMHTYRSDYPGIKKSYESSGKCNNRVRQNFRGRGRRGPVSQSRQRRTQRPESWQKGSDRDEERL